jgi:UDPglucose 6-dehydrogenase
VSKYLLDEGAQLSIFDPKVEEKQALFELSNSQLNLPFDLVKANTQFFSENIMEACQKSHAIVVCTEWDMFKSLDYEEIYKVMQKPAYVFDGRLILDHEQLKKIGFNVVAIGK